MKYLITEIVNENFYVCALKEQVTELTIQLKKLTNIEMLMSDDICFGGTITNNIFGVTPRY